MEVPAFPFVPVLVDLKTFPSRPYDGRYLASIDILSLVPSTQNGSYALTVTTLGGRSGGAKLYITMNKPAGLLYS